MDSLKQLSPSFAETITIPVKLFLFIGLDFFNDTKIRYCWKLNSFIIGFFTFLSGNFFYFANIDKNNADFLEVANAIPIVLILLQDLFKLTIIRKKHLIRTIIFEIAELWPEEFQNEEKDKIMSEWLRRLNTFCSTTFKVTFTGELVYMWLLIFIYFVGSYGDGEISYQYPFPLYYFIKIDALWKYLIFYTMQAVTGNIIHTCVYLSCDLLLVALTVDVCVLLRLVQYDLENIRVERGREESLTELKHIVKTHQKLLRLAEDLNDIFGGIMFTVIVFSSVIICFFVFLTTVDQERFQSVINLTAVLQLLFIVFYIMMPGQILSDTSSGVADAAYNILWYNSDPKFRKLIYIIIARAQKPCKLQALGYADMNCNAFCKICNTTLSYLSLITQLYQER